MIVKWITNKVQVSILHWRCTDIPNKATHQILNNLNSNCVYVLCLCVCVLLFKHVRVDKREYYTWK